MTLIPLRYNEIRLVPDFQEMIFCPQNYNDIPDFQKMTLCPLSHQSNGQKNWYSTPKIIQKRGQNVNYFDNFGSGVSFKKINKKVGCV